MRVKAGREIEVAGDMPARFCLLAGCPVGTTVEIHNLFYNTPVRRKFQRTPQTEFGHISEAFTRIALALLGAVHFHAGQAQRIGGRCLILAGTRLRVMKIAAERIARRLRPRSLAERLIYVSSADGEVRISGCVAHPSQSRSNNRMQYLFLNGRHIRDHALQHALAEAYRGLLMVGRYAIAFLSIEMPAEMVDVNVHPTKLEVRFRDGGRLYSQLLSTLRSKFLTTDLTTQGHAPPAATEEAGAAHDEARAAQVRQELVAWAKGRVADWQPPSEGGSATAAATLASAEGADEPWARGEPLRQYSFPAAESATGAAAIGTDEHPIGHAAFDQAKLMADSCTCRGRNGAVVREDPAHVSRREAEESVPAERTYRPALQIHNRYLVTESEEGVTIIDQHALHERILFEQIRARIDAGALETQNLLVPEPVDLSPPEAAIAMEHRDVLGQVGPAESSFFGGDTVLVTGLFRR